LEIKDRSYILAKPRSRAQSQSRTHKKNRHQVRLTRRSGHTRRKVKIGFTYFRSIALDHYFSKPMLEQAAEALNRRDYKTAAKLIATLTAQEPDNHQVQLCAAKLQEATNEFDTALAIYRGLLINAINMKISTEARQGIQRIETIQAEIQAQAKVLEKAGIEDNTTPGLLILEPIDPALKQAAAQRLAKIMDIDPYSARLQLPTRGWRLYRVGAMGELEFYYNQFQQAEIPSFCVSKAATRQFFVFRVNYFQSIHSQPAIVCMDDRSELRTFNFEWSDVTKVVMGMLPIFEEVVEIDARQRTYRKSKILDYIHVCDLQLRGRRSIFRLCSQTYDFCDYKQLITQHRRDLTGDLRNRLEGEIDGMLNGSKIPTTSHDNWKNLMAQVRERVADVTVHNEFTPFAETAIGYPELLSWIDPHLELLRRHDSLWDRAFQLYSTLAMCRN
jgi:hypothetical protein